ncbi:MAG: MurR/RpiR family transcriptional regulator [Candidatus Limiplasma sp.]|nr:MurR/RpiR family transcriptional regulator [Candidatus Limiplasma sp.]
MTISRFLVPSLTKSEKKAAQLLLDDPGMILNLTLAEYAQKAQCSPASILRFCRRLGVDGFPEFKMHVLLALKDGESAPAYNHEISSSDSLDQILEKVFFYNIQALKDTLALVSKDHYKALKALAGAKSIQFFCLGDAAVPGQLACIKFQRLGIRCAVHIDADTQLVTASTMGKGDVAIALSYSGRSRTVVEAMRLAKESGATTICITKMDKSPLIKHCDIKLFTATTDVTVGKEIIARRIAEQAIMEALYLGLITKERPEYKENIKKTAKVLEFNKL